MEEETEEINDNMFTRKNVTKEQTKHLIKHIHLIFLKP